jgi:hypothetical protein
MPKRTKRPLSPLQKRVRAVLKTLKPGERRRLLKRLRCTVRTEKTPTLEDVGRSFEQTRRRIREIERKALRKLAERRNEMPKTPPRGLRVPPKRMLSKPTPGPFLKLVTGLAPHVAGAKRRPQRGSHRKRKARPGRGKPKG